MNPRILKAARARVTDPGEALRKQETERETARLGKITGNRIRPIKGDFKDFKNGKWYNSKGQVIGLSPTEDAPVTSTNSRRFRSRNYNASS